MNYPVKANCQCGRVSYELNREPLGVFACHCTECQKLATTPFSVTALCLAEDIQFFGEMKEWRRSSESGNINAAKFCPNCGNRIFHYNPDDPTKIKLKLKPVDSESACIFEPTTHLWVSEKVEWVEIPEHATVLPKGP